MTPTPTPNVPVPTTPAQAYRLPTVAFVLSVLGGCLCVTGPLGMILAIVALVRISKEPHLVGKGLAIAALVIPIVLLPVQGIVGAIAVPNFVKFQARAKQQECRANLRAMANAQRARRAEKSDYATTFAELGFTPPAHNRYSYFLSETEVFKVDTSRSPRAKPEAYAQELSKLGLKPGINGEHVLMACVGNVDGDPDLDVWTTDESDREPTNVENDVEGSR
jgi:type IV pilus assembly protein PilA